MSRFTQSALQVWINRAAVHVRRSIKSKNGT
jgi:hypothetical protein